MTLNPFMQAHGATPGPTQRPLATGALTGLFALFLTSPLLYLAASIAPISLPLHLNPRLTLPILYAAIFFLGSLLYARLFRRAANDRRGGWLFGISFGFLLWLLGPVTLLQLFHPLLTGPPALTLFAAHLLFGTLLGLLFPPLHRLLRSPL